jgi:hypothetical protein
MPEMETEGFEHEESLGPDHPGSMASKLARTAEAPRQAAEAEAAPVIEEPPPEAEALQGAAEPEPESPPEPPEPKFQTVEEYEKALKAAETRMHTATEEAAELRKAREDLAAEIELTRTELATVRAEQEAAAKETAKAVPKAERTAAFKDALSKIQAIPLTRGDDGEVVYPDNYDDQVAEAWASTSLDPEEVAKMAAKLAREEIKRERQVEDTRTAAEREEAVRAQIRADAEKMATAQGLDMTPGSADYRLFYSHVDELAGNPEHEYREKPFEEQVKWAAGGVRQILGKKIEMTDAERIAAKRNQERNVVLERGITRRVTPEQPKQRSMNEILTGHPAAEV